MITEILMPPCTFDEILKAGRKTNLTSFRGVMIHKDNNMSAHVELFIQNSLLVRLRCYDLTEIQFEELLEYGFEKR